MRNGFTLVELLVAISIGALLMAFAPSALSRLNDSVQYRAGVREVALAVQGARAQALRDGLPTVFVADVANGRYGIEGGELDTVPASLFLAATVARGSGEDGLSRIHFYPDGSSSGGTVEVHRRSGGGAAIRVDWLLGRVSQYRLADELP